MNIYSLYSIQVKNRAYSAVNNFRRVAGGQRPCAQVNLRVPIRLLTID